MVSINYELNRRDLLRGFGLAVAGFGGFQVKEVEAGRAGRALEDRTRKEFAGDDDQTLFARMLYGEAGGVCGKNERIVIGLTAMNRIKDKKAWNGNDIRSVLLKAAQYSCFDDSEYRKLGKNGRECRAALKNADVNGSHVWDECMEVAKDIIDGVYEDLTYQVHPNKSFGVTHYHHKSLKFPWSDKDKFVEFPDNPREFKHKFYIEI